MTDEKWKFELNTKCPTSEATTKGEVHGCLESIVAQAGSMLEDGVDDVAVKLHPVFLSGVLRSLLMNKVSLRYEVVLSDGRGVWQFTIPISCIC